MQQQNVNAKYARQVSPTHALLHLYRVCETTSWDDQAAFTSYPCETIVWIMHRPVVKNKKNKLIIFM
jgi:hypothetical protein